MSAFFSLFVFLKEIKDPGITASIIYIIYMGNMPVPLSSVHLQLPSLLPWHLLMFHFLPPLSSCLPRLVSSNSPQTCHPTKPPIFSFFLLISQAQGEFLIFFFIYLPYITSVPRFSWKSRCFLRATSQFNFRLLMKEV